MTIYHFPFLLPYNGNNPIFISEFQDTREVGEFFRLKPAKADSVIEQVVSVVKEWRHEASILGISTSDQNRMAVAFRYSSY